jgi:hypothetical protein
MVVGEPSSLFPTFETFDQSAQFEKIKEPHARQILIRKTSTDGITFLEMHLHMQVSLFEPFCLLLQWLTSAFRESFGFFIFPFSVSTVG